MTTYADLIAKLKAKNWPVIESKGQVTTQCPVHEDDSPSFSITAKGGKLMLNCFVCAPKPRTSERREWFKRCLAAFDGPLPVWVLNPSPTSRIRTGKHLPPVAGYFGYSLEDPII